MDIGYIDPSHQKHSGLKQPVLTDKEATSPFKSELLSRLTVLPGAVSATDQLHQQSLLKARKGKKVKRFFSDTEEDESVMGAIQDIKKTLRKLREMERWFLGL